MENKGYCLSFLLVELNVSTAELHKVSTPDVCILGLTKSGLLS